MWIWKSREFRLKPLELGLLAGTALVVPTAMLHLVGKNMFLSNPLALPLLVLGALIPATVGARLALRARPATKISRANQGPPREHQQSQILTQRLAERNREFQLAMDSCRQLEERLIAIEARVNAMSSQVRNARQSPPAQHQQISNLSTKILALCRKGLSNTQIATQLGLDDAVINQEMACLRRRHEARKSVGNSA